VKENLKRRFEGTTPRVGRDAPAFAWKRNPAVHHPQSHRLGLRQFLLSFLLVILVTSTPDLAMAQASPFLTGATALQTKGRTLLAAASCVHEAFPGAQIRAFALLRTMGLISGIQRLLDPCKGEIRWRSGDAHRSP
jgi:hypothetical protein